MSTAVENARRVEKEKLTVARSGVISAILDGVADVAGRCGDRQVSWSDFYNMRQSACDLLSHVLCGGEYYALPLNSNSLCNIFRL